MELSLHILSLGLSNFDKIAFICHQYLSIILIYWNAASLTVLGV